MASLKRPAPADEDEMAFTVGQQVFILAPHAMHGNTGSIVGMNPRQGGFLVSMLGGRVATVGAEHMRLVRHVLPRYPVPKSRPSASSSSTTAPVETTTADKPELGFKPLLPTSKASAPVATAVTTSSTTTPSETAPEGCYGYKVLFDNGEVKFFLPENLEDA